MTELRDMLHGQVGLDYQTRQGLTLHWYLDLAFFDLFAKHGELGRCGCMAELYLERAVGIPGEIRDLMEEAVTVTWPRPGRPGQQLFPLQWAAKCENGGVNFTFACP